MCSDCNVRVAQVVDAFLTKVANFSEIAVWVTGVLCVLEFVAIFIYAYRAGMVDEEARCSSAAPGTLVRCPWSMGPRRKPSA